MGAEKREKNKARAGGTYMSATSELPSLSECVEFTEVE